MNHRTRPERRLVRVSVVLLALFAPLVLTAAVGVARAVASSPASPEPAGNEPLVNWTWLAVGLGGVVIMLVIMFLLTRVFGNRRREEE